MYKFLSTLLLAGLFWSAAAVDVYLAGDSTMADYPAEHRPQTGWGQTLRLYAKDGVKIHNLARGGRSSKSFRSEGRWEMLLSQVSPGDFVIIQFGHNDAHTGEKNLYRHADPEKAYPDNLRQYIRDVRQKKGIPVLVSPTAFCTFKDGKAVNSDHLDKYVAACRLVAAEEKVDFIDLNAWALAELTKAGEKASRGYYMYIESGKFPNYPQGRQDGCHLQLSGAHFYTAGMIRLAQAQQLAIGKIFNTVPRQEKPAAAPGTGVNMHEEFFKFAFGEAIVAIEDESTRPWKFLQLSGGRLPECKNGFLQVRHSVGEIRIVSKAQIVTGKFKARIRIHDSAFSYNAFIGLVSTSPWMKQMPVFHFNNPNLRATMYQDGKRKSTPALKPGVWHDLEIRVDAKRITYLLDGKEIFAGAAPEEKTGLSAAFIINCKKGGKIDFDVDSVSLEGIRATAASVTEATRYDVPAPAVCKIRPEPAPAPLKITAGKTSAAVSSRYFSMKFDAAGELMLTSLFNKYSGRELLSKPTEFFSVFLKQSRAKTADYRVKKIAAKGNKLVFDLVSRSTATNVVLTLTFQENSPEYTAEMVLKNSSGKDLECGGQFVIQGLQFSGNIANDGIFYPFESGMAGILDVELEHQYGITATMQMMTGFDAVDGGSFYGFTTDTTGYSKLMSLIKTSNGKRPGVIYSPIAPQSSFWPVKIFDFRKGISMGWRNFDLQVKNGSSAVIAAGKFGVGPSDWRDGIAAYRKFSRTFLKKRHVPPRWYQDCFIHLSSHPNSNHHQMTPRTHQGGHFDVVNRRYAYSRSMGVAEKRGLQEIAFWWDYGADRAFMSTAELGRLGLPFIPMAPCDYTYNVSRGGLPALRQEIKDIHAKGGRLVFYTFPEGAAEGSEHHRLFGKRCAQMPVPGVYKDSYCRPGKDFVLCPMEHDWVDFLSKKFAGIIRETGADGLRLDVMARNYHCFNPEHRHYDGSYSSSMKPEKLAQALSLFQDRIYEANPEASVTTEHAGTDYIMQFTDGWFSQNINAFADNGRWGPYRKLNTYRQVFIRYTFPESKVWMHSGTFTREGAMMSLFNAVGFCVTRGEGQFTARTLEENADVIAACVDPVPGIPTLHRDILANIFPAPGNQKVLYGVYNCSDKAVEAEILEVPDEVGFHYVELYADLEVKAAKVNGKLRLTARLDADTAGNIVRLPELLKAEIRPDGMLQIVVGGGDAAYDGLEVKVVYDQDLFDGSEIVCRPENGKLLLPLRKKYNKLIIKLVDGIYLRDQIVINK